MGWEGKGEVDATIGCVIEMPWGYDGVNGLGVGVGVGISRAWDKAWGGGVDAEGGILLLIGDRSRGGVHGSGGGGG